MSDVNDVVPVVPVRQARKAVWAVPAGGVKPNEEGKIVTEGYDVDDHARLKLSDFSGDTLNYAIWEVWFYEQKLARAMTSVDEIRADGSTQAERDSAADFRKQLKEVGKSTAKALAGGGENAKLMRDRLRALLAEYETI